MYTVGPFKKSRMYVDAPKTIPKIIPSAKISKQIIFFFINMSFLGEDCCEDFSFQVQSEVTLV